MPVYDVNGVTSPAQEDFRRDLQAVINKHSRENGSNTPDYILADYLIGCLRALDIAVNDRSAWYGRIDTPRGGITITAHLQSAEKDGKL
jgi:hypothetical protein